MDLLILPPLQALELSLLETTKNPVTLTTLSHTHCFHLKKNLFTFILCVVEKRGYTYYNKSVKVRAQLTGISVPFLPCGFRDWTRVQRLGGEHLCPLSHPESSYTVFGVLFVFPDLFINFICMNVLYVCMHVCTSCCSFAFGGYG